MISFRRCSQRTLPSGNLSILTLCSSKVRQLLRAAPGMKPRKRLSPNSPLTLDLPRLKRTAGRPSASPWDEIARVIHGMILGVMVGMAAESPGSNGAGQGVTYSRENIRAFNAADRPNL
jgi:hypothetical protein